MQSPGSWVGIGPMCLAGSGSGPYTRLARGSGALYSPRSFVRRVRRPGTTGQAGRRRRSWSPRSFSTGRLSRSRCCTERPYPAPLMPGWEPPAPWSRPSRPPPLGPPPSRAFMALGSPATAEPPLAPGSLPVPGPPPVPGAPPVPGPPPIPGTPLAFGIKLVWSTQSPSAAASSPLRRGTSCTDIRNVPMQLSPCQTLSTTRSRSGCQVTRSPVPRSSRNISRRDDSARVFSTGLGWSLSGRYSRPPAAGRRPPGDRVGRFPECRHRTFPHSRRGRPLRVSRRLGCAHAYQAPRRSRRPGAAR